MAKILLGHLFHTTVEANDVVGRKESRAADGRDRMLEIKKTRRDPVNRAYRERQSGDGGPLECESRRRQKGFRREPSGKVARCSSLSIDRKPRYKIQGLAGSAPVNYCYDLDCLRHASLDG